MKLVILFLCVAFVSVAKSNAQDVTVSVDSQTGDTIVTTAFDTLHMPLPSDKDKFPDKVVGVKTIQKGKSTYWLFFYFSTADITNNPVNIGKGNNAYLVKPSNEYMRLPYKGKSFRYSRDDNAGFFIDVTDHVDRILSSPLKVIRLETSVFYHEIVLPDAKSEAISNLLRKLE